MAFFRADPRACGVRTCMDTWHVATYTYVCVQLDGSYCSEHNLTRHAIRTEGGHSSGFSRPHLDQIVIRHRDELTAADRQRSHQNSVAIERAHRLPLALCALHDDRATS